MLADRQFLAVQMLNMSTASAYKQAPRPHAWQNVPMHVHFSTKLSLFLTILVSKMADFHALCILLAIFASENMHIFLARENKTCSTLRFRFRENVPSFEPLHYFDIHTHPVMSGWSNHARETDVYGRWNVRLKNVLKNCLMFTCRLVEHAGWKSCR